MPESVDRCVEEVEKQPSIKNPYAICWSQYKKTQQKKKQKEAKLNNKLQTKLKKMFRSLD